MGICLTVEFCRSSDAGLGTFPGFLRGQPRALRHADHASHRRERSVVLLCRLRSNAECAGLGNEDECMEVATHAIETPSLTQSRVCNENCGIDTLGDPASRRDEHGRCSWYSACCMCIGVVHIRPYPEILSQTPVVSILRQAIIAASQARTTSRLGCHRISMVASVRRGCARAKNVNPDRKDRVGTNSTNT